MTVKKPVQFTGAAKKPPVAELQPVKTRMEMMRSGAGAAAPSAQGRAAAQTEISSASTQTPVAGTEKSNRQEQEMSPTSNQEKVYSFEELEQYQKEEGEADRAEWAAGAQFYRSGSGYTNTPNERTIRLAQPIYDDLIYYDPGVKVYGGQSGGTQMGTGGQSGGGTGERVPDGSAGVHDSTAGSRDLTSLLEEWKKAAAEQANGQIDYSVSQAVAELERAVEDSRAYYQEQAEAVARDERQALDNSALYAELRGDKGGIGRSQYNEIQAAAANNRLAVQQAQTKLATDTARKIADLRAQGEFEKADKALAITQQYLAQLISLEQWAEEFNLNQRQFREAIRQWEAEYALAMKEFNYNVSRNERNNLASIAEALLAAGVQLNAEQLAAMGISKEQMNDLLEQKKREESGRMTLGDLSETARKIYYYYANGTGMPTPALMESLIEAAGDRIGKEEKEFLLLMAGV